MYAVGPLNKLLIKVVNRIPKFKIIQTRIKNPYMKKTTKVLNTCSRTIE
jgi:hypothetical protein